MPTLLLEAMPKVQKANLASVKENLSEALYIENGALLQDVMRSWKMILGGHGKSWKNFLQKKCGKPVSSE